MKIAVLMTCHDRKEMTLRCLASLRGQEMGREGFDHGLHGFSRIENLDVFLNDDGCTDGTGEAVEKFGRVEVEKGGDGVGGGEWKIHVVKGSGKDYWAKGMERAWKAAVEWGRFEPCRSVEGSGEEWPCRSVEMERGRGRFEPCRSVESVEESVEGDGYDAFLWLNDDVVLKPGAIRGLVEDCGDGGCVVVGACSMDASERESSYSATTKRDEQIFPNGALQRADGWFNGNCVLVPRAVYEKVGMIDGAYSHARADYDYAERLKRAGVPIYCSSHFVGVCEKDWARKPRPETLAGRLALLFRPGYFNLSDMWRYRVRYYGVGRAIVSCAHLVWMQVRG